MTSRILISLLLLALVPATASAASADQYRIAVTSAGAAGDPDVLVAATPLKVGVRGPAAGGDTLQVCLEPAPIDRPACTAGRLNRVVDAGAPPTEGRTALRVVLADGTTLERDLEILSSREADEVDRQAFAGRPEVVFTRNARGTASFAVLARLRTTLPARGDVRPAFLVAPSLLRGEVFAAEQDFYGGLTPGRYGRASRRCYFTEGQQLRPLVRPRDGARWSLGLTTANRVGDTVRATVRSVRRSRLDGTIARAAKRLGCGAPVR